MTLSPVQYDNGNLRILDQPVLPWEERYLTLSTREDVWDAIDRMVDIPPRSELGT